MKFTEFKNGNDFLEYIQIYVYYHLHEKKDDVNIDDYNSFELTDVVVTKFNRWVKKIQDNDPVILCIIRKTKCFDFWERNVLFPKTKRSFFRTPTLPFSA